MNFEVFFTVKRQYSEVDGLPKEQDTSQEGKYLQLFPILYLYVRLYIVHTHVHVLVHGRFLINLKSD